MVGSAQNGSSAGAAQSPASCQRRVRSKTPPSSINGQGQCASCPVAEALVNIAVPSPSIATVLKLIVLKLLPRPYFPPGLVGIFCLDHGLSLGARLGQTTAIFL